MEIDKEIGKKLEESFNHGMEHGENRLLKEILGKILKINLIPEYELGL